MGKTPRCFGSHDSDSRRCSGCDWSSGCVNQTSTGGISVPKTNGELNQINQSGLKER